MMKVSYDNSLVAKGYWNDNTFTRREQRKRPRRLVFGRLLCLFIFLCCCLTAVIFAIDSMTGSFPIVLDQQLNANVSPNAESNTFFNNDISVNEQNNNDVIFAQSNVGDTSWRLILVNKWNYIPDGYKVELTELSNGQTVDKRIYPALQEMFTAARSSGIYPVVVSGYRTMEKQQSLLDEKIAFYKAEGYSTEKAIARAETKIAIPGTSEHQLGIAVDINADGIHSTGEEVYTWLSQNSYRFGFIRRYATEKTEITGVINEPWHYRYVGVDAATEMYQQGICLEEYLGQINQRGY